MDKVTFKIQQFPFCFFKITRGRGSFLNEMFAKRSPFSLWSGNCCIRYKMGDRVRFYTDPCPCGSPFRSYQVEGRQATILHIGDAALSALAFHLEHE